MEARLVKVYSTTNANAKPIELRFSGSTQGDLLRALNIESSNVTVRGRQTRSEYPFNDSVLSIEDTFFFIGPKKMDSGAGVPEHVYESIETLRTQLQDTINEVFAEIFETLDEVEVQENTGCEECDALKQEAKNLGF